MTPDHIPIHYACVSKGPTVLVELTGDGDLRPLAARCLEAAPRFHRFYTHTAGGRIYAFLTEDHLAFFAIADEALGRPQALLFLRRVRDAFSSAAVGSRSVDGLDPLSPLCFQDEFLPVLRQLVVPIPSDLDKPPPPPSSPPSDAPLTAVTPSEAEDSKRGRGKKAKAVKKKRNGDDDDTMEISVVEDDGDDADAGMGTRELKSPLRSWRRHVWMILLADLVVCTFLFVVWLSVCRGFQCIAR